MTVRVDLNGLLAPVVGADGLPPEDLESLAPELARVRTLLAARRVEGALAFAELPYRRDDLQHVLETAAAVREEFDTLVVLGTGGSVAAARALIAALAPEGTPGLRVMVADSIDPESMEALLATLDLRRTLFDAVSRSGDTTETMAQFMIVRDRLLHELGAVDYKRHVLVTTDAEHGSLRQIVNDEGFRDLVIPSGVDARFAALTAVGLFPLAAAGVDLEELCAGAAMMDDRGRAAETPLADPALALASTLWLLATRRQRRLIALASYCGRLTGVAEWYATLGAFAHPPTEPRDEVVLFLRVEDHGAEFEVPAAYQDLEDVGYLGGHPLAVLLNAEQRAAEVARARRGQPSATVTLPAVNPFTVGQLMYLLEMASVMAGALAGGGPVAPPGSDEMRRIACGLLGRPGFTEARAEAEAILARKDPRFVL